ncbi:hypothetical protein ACJ3XI_04820 [Litorimonas sp. RW-G-Af-16]|uniref:hypothetical protein n=1 Tax=Litorimonas sp. RW-G-Af-16 TaxID=3241168 RepID=UPI00390C479B
MSFKKLALAGGAAAMLMGSTAYASVIDRPFFQVLGVVVVWGGTDTAANSGTAPVVSDFVLLTPASGTAGADLIAGDVYSVVTGTLDPIPGSATAVGAATFDPVTGETSGGVFTDAGTVGVLDAADTLTAFGIDAATDIGGGLVGTHNSSFYVASNAAFNISATSSALAANGDFASMSYDNIALDMSITPSGTDGGLAFGSAAQVPGTVVTGENLGTLNAAPTTVMTGTQKTAATVGTLAEQSVRINSVYTLDADSATAGVQGYDLSMGVGTLQADVTYTVFVP